MARVHTKKAGKDYKCGKCGDKIPKGSEYRYAQPGFRSRNRLIRCSKPACRFRQSELTTSKMSAVYAAVETAEDEINNWDGEDSADLTSFMETCASEVRTVAEEYASAAEAMGGAGEQLQQKADGLEAWADELEGVDFEDKPEVNICEHGDHKAPDGERFCSEECKKCEAAEVPEGQECANLCRPEDDGEEAEDCEDWRRACRDACTELLSNVPEE